jgi:MFS transporter, FSR family, fosmidomycin resistance protein
LFDKTLQFLLLLALTFNVQRNSMNLPTQRKFWAVGIGHFTNDVFMSVTGVILTFLSVSILPMSLTQIGFIVSAQGLAGALGQPFFGWRADKTGGRGIGGGGLALVVCSFSLALFLAITTKNYYLMLIPFILQGLGSSMTHPVGSLHSAEADELRISSNMSYFFLMGQLGLAIGPALVGYLLDSASVHALITTLANGFGLPALGNSETSVAPIFFLGLAALPSVIFMWAGIPAHRAVKKRTPKDGEAVSRRAAIMPFIVIGVMILLRALAQPSSVSFVPILFAAKGWSATEFGLITSLYSLSSAITGVICGNLADRYDRRQIVLWTMLLATPAFFALPYVDGLLAYLVAFAAGGLSGGSHSLIIVLAQELIPNSKGFASGSILGFIFAAGALGSLVIGFLADSFGLGTSFQIIGVLGALSGVVALLLPKAKPQLETA